CPYREIKRVRLIRPVRVGPTGRLGSMDVIFIHPRELSRADVDAWRTLRGADARYESPFFAPEFAVAAASVRDDARVALVRDGSAALRLVLPVKLSASGLARPLGAPMCDANGPVAAEDMRGRLAEVLAEAGIAAYAFSGWPEAAPAKGVKLRARDGSAVADL